MKKRSASKLLCSLLLSLSSCAPKPVAYSVPALANQVLMALPGHTGLVLKRRVYDDKGAVSWETKDYDLNDAAVRKQLNDLKFACNVNGVPYLIAEHRASLIQVIYDQCWIPIVCKRTERVVDEIPIAQYDRLVNAQTVCFSLEQYRFDSPGKVGVNE